MVVHADSPLLHPASFLAPSAHEPELLRLLDSAVSQDIIDYVIDFTSEVVDFALSRPGPSSSKRAPRSDSTFAALAERVIRTAEVTVPTLLVSLVYMHRAKRHLQIALEQWACERVFLGALVLASKYCNDSTLKNVHWAWATGTFGKSDMLRIEREFLDVLDFELGVREHELLPFQHSLARSVPAPKPAPVTIAKPKRARTSSRKAISPASVPELSSPSSSSSASSSPCTPPHHPHHRSAPRYPPGIPLHHHAKGTVDAPIDVDVNPDTDGYMDVDISSSEPSPLEPSTGKSKTRPARPRRTHSTLDVLMSFPLPRCKVRSVAPPKSVARPVVPPRSSEVWV